jgi:protein-disulfide isomerase
MNNEIKILVIIAFVQNAPVTGTSGATGKPSIPPETLVRPDSPTLGSSDAPVTLVEFLDPECESCAAFAPIVKKILQDYDGKVRLVVRYMPLHHNSLRAAALTEAAGEQGNTGKCKNCFSESSPNGANDTVRRPPRSRQMSALCLKNTRWS